MQKILLISILVVTVAIPMRAARNPSPTAGLRKAVLGVALFNLAYLVFLRFIYPRLF
ncbi:MAG: hypothetical protein ACJ8AO_08935 [Gemmatimonadaceae bacterium]